MFDDEWISKEDNAKILDVFMKWMTPVCMHACVSVCMHVYVFNAAKILDVFMKWMTPVCMHVCVSVCMHVCMYVYLRGHVTMLVCMYVCVDAVCACTYVCMYDIGMYACMLLYYYMFLVTRGNAKLIEMCVYVCMHVCIYTY